MTSFNSLNFPDLPHDDFWSFRFSTSALTGNDDARVMSGAFHRLVGRLGDGEDVRGSLVDFPALETKKFFFKVAVL